MATINWEVAGYCLRAFLLIEILIHLPAFGIVRSLPNCIRNNTFCSSNPNIRRFEHQSLHTTILFRLNLCNFFRYNDGRYAIPANSSLLRHLIQWCFHFDEDGIFFGFSTLWQKQDCTIVNFDRRKIIWYISSVDWSSEYSDVGGCRLFECHSYLHNSEN